MANKPSRKEALASRKFLLAIISIMLLTLMSYLGISSPAVQGILPSFNSGLLGVLGLYFAGNVVNKHIVGKQVQDGDSEGEE